MLKSVFLLGFAFIVAQCGAQNRFSNDLRMKVIYQHQYDQNSKGLLSFLHHKEVKYREAAALAFASIQDSAYVDTLMNCLSKDPEPRVKIAAIYSLGQLRLNSVSKRLQGYYKDKKYAAYKNELLMAIGKGAQKSDLNFYNEIVIKDKDSLQQKAYVYSVFQAYRRQKSLATQGGEALFNNLQHIAKINQSAAVQAYLKPFLMSPVNRDENRPEKKPFVRNESIDSAFIQSKPYEAIRALEGFVLTEKDWQTLAYQNYPYAFTSHCLEQYLKTVKQVSSAEYRQLLASGNIAFISMAAEHMRSDSVWLSKANEEVQYLKTVQAALQMPKDFEAWVDLEKTICQVEKRKYQYQSWFERTGYKHPIDWEYVRIVPENLKVRITTNKGAFTMVLKINEAPGSVVNFLKLLDSNYFDKKYFHRMVPDFVVQGGCPRGDGWGSLNWTQRSELSNYLMYQPGSVGLASAGKDSEGVQFFVTHTYTAHLDGRYTIFAELVEGMEVVNSLWVGDQILYVEKI